MEVHRRVTRVQNRLLALMARVKAGRQVGGWSRTAPVLPEGDVLGDVLGGVLGGLPRTRKPQAIVLPRRFGWLVHLVGYQAAGRGSQLAHLLGDPEMVALVRDVPQARRILAPLCRMLGVTMEGPAVVRRPRVRPVVARVVAADLLPASLVTRFGYVPSAKWPRGGITRGSGRLKPA